jgi:hypothetical protein
VIRRGAWIGLAASALLLGGCSLAGSLHFGDVSLGLHSGFAALGSHVGFFVD